MNLVRRYQATGPNGPAEPVIAANISWLASARSVVRVLRHSGLRQTGVRTGIGMLQQHQGGYPGRNPATEPVRARRVRGIS